MKIPPTRRIRWKESYRVVNSRFPPVDVFERVAEGQDWDTLIELEMLTNPRVREQVGEIALVPAEERVSGPGASWLMAPFTHVGWPSRFSDGTFGVYYAARQLLTAVHEKGYHVGRFYRATREPLGTTMELRALIAKVDSQFHDLRGGHPGCHRPDDYGPSQALAKQLRSAGSNGVVYDSVRHPGGACLAAFRPKAVHIPISGPNLRFHFDGDRIDRWFNFSDRMWHTL